MSNAKQRYKVFKKQALKNFVRTSYNRGEGELYGLPGKQLRRSFLEALEKSSMLISLSALQTESVSIISISGPMAPAKHTPSPAITTILLCLQCSLSSERIRENFFLPIL